MKLLLNEYQAAVQVPLTQGLFARIDSEDAAVITGRKWCAHKVSGKVYAATTVDGKTVHMHRLLLPDVPLVDHIDGDGLNNSRANLRSASSQGNATNRKKRAGRYSSQFKGVYLYRGKWFSRITSNGKTYSLGLFESEKAAALSYNEAARRLFGSFAKLNEV